MEERPKVILIGGDTNTVMAGALALARLGIKAGHVEAGLRSFDRSMPKELNRIIADHLSDLLFAPTPQSKKNLIREGVYKEKIFITGNTIVDAIQQNVLFSQSRDIYERLGLTGSKYCLLTMHRQENVDNPKRLMSILEGIEELDKEYDYRIVYSVHPRTERMLRKFNLLNRLRKVRGVLLTRALGYWDFLALIAKARLVLTDSGGVQEEFCILKVPCVTLRDNTERLETLKVGSTVLVGSNPSAIFKGVKKMLSKKRTWSNPFGDGYAAKRIIQICLNEGCA